MLNLDRQEHPLTQGQAPGSQVVARSVHIDDMTSAVQAAPSGQPASTIDPQVIAQVVWEMLRQELRINRERRMGSKE